MAPAGAQDPSPEERTREVVELTELYFRTRSRGDLEGAHAMLSPALRESLPLDRYAAMWTDLFAEGGRLVDVGIVEVTWYGDPDAPPPGLSAALDYRGRFENFPVYCGYLVWRAEGDGYVLAREQVGVLPEDAYEAMGGDDARDAALAALSCD